MSSGLQAESPPRSSARGSHGRSPPGRGRTGYSQPRLAGRSTTRTTTSGSGRPLWAHCASKAPRRSGSTICATRTSRGCRWRSAGFLNALQFAGRLLAVGAKSRDQRRRRDKSCGPDIGAHAFHQILRAASFLWFTLRESLDRNAEAVSGRGLDELVFVPPPSLPNQPDRVSRHEPQSADPVRGPSPASKIRQGDDRSLPAAPSCSQVPASPTTRWRRWWPSVPG